MIWPVCGRILAPALKRIARAMELIEIEIKRLLLVGGAEGEGLIVHRARRIACIFLKLYCEAVRFELRFEDKSLSSVCGGEIRTCNGQRRIVQRLGRIIILVRHHFHRPSGEMVAGVRCSHRCERVSGYRTINHSEHAALCRNTSHTGVVHIELHGDFADTPVNGVERDFCAILCDFQHSGVHFGTGSLCLNRVFLLLRHTSCVCQAPSGKVGIFRRRSRKVHECDARAKGNTVFLHNAGFSANIGLVNECCMPIRRSSCAVCQIVLYGVGLGCEFPLRRQCQIIAGHCNALPR